MSEIELHRKLLGDAGRNRSLQAALKAVLKPGMSVVDVGAGTGFLSFLARRMGAAHCTLIEYSDAIGLARRLAKENRIDGLDFIQGHSREVRGLPRADVVISETLGNFALEEGLLETLLDARRFLKPDGVMIPCRLLQFAAPVASPRLQQEIDVWPDVGFGLDLSAARRISLNNFFVKTLQPSDLAGPPRCWDTLDFSPSSDKPSSARDQRVGWKSAELDTARIHGFALWWSVDWVEGIRFSTAPDAPATHWEQIYLPLLSPIEVSAGEVLELDLKVDTRPTVGLRLTWEVAVRHGGRRTSVQKLDSLQGRL